MIKSFNIPIKERIQLFQVWLASINWTLGSNQLTQAELEILSYFIYYNDKYRSIKENDVRMDLLFSTTIKSKIKKEFDTSTHKLETYLNKLRKKNVIQNNSISEKFIIYPETSIQVQFNSVLHNSKTEKPAERSNSESASKDVESIQSTKVENSETPTSSNVESSSQKDILNETDDLDDLDEADSKAYDPRNDFDKYFNNDTPIESWM